MNKGNQAHQANKVTHKKIFKIIKNVTVNLIIFILGIIAMATIWTSIQINVQNKEYINIFGYSIFSTATGSMSPTIEIGDIVLVKVGQEAKEEDIITYKKDNEFITHRVIKIDGESIIAKGDNNNTQDEAINKDAIIGKVVYIINNVEVWKKVFLDPSVLGPMVLTVVLFVILVSYKEQNGTGTDIGENK